MTVRCAVVSELEPNKSGYHGSTKGKKEEMRDMWEVE
jgi:hypothetical protein